MKVYTNLKCRDLARDLRRKGFTLLRQRGSHQTWGRVSERVGIAFHSPAHDASRRDIKVVAGLASPPEH